MTDEDADDGEQAAIGHEHVEAEQDPGKVHRLEASAEPEADDCFFVELTPHVEHRENHRVHQEGQ